MKFRATILTITKAELAALLAFASKNAERENYGCIWIEPARGRAFATDGMRVLALTTQPGEMGPKTTETATFAIRAATLTRALRAFDARAVLMIGNRKGEVRILESAEAAGSEDVYMIEVMLGAARKTAPPPIDTVLDVPTTDGRPLASFGVDALLLADVRHIAKLAPGVNGERAVTVFPGDPLRVVVETEDGTTAVALIKPSRTVTASAVTARQCVTCGGAFAPPRTDAQYCSSACRQRAYRERQAEEIPVAAE